MNKLVIDTTERDQIKIKIYKDSKNLEKKIGQKFGSQVLLAGIKELLVEAKITLQDIEGIEVGTGPGSFTGVRVGVSVANALAFALGITVNGKQTESDLLYT